jgi:T-complex protein 11
VTELALLAHSESTENLFCEEEAGEHWRVLDMHENPRDTTKENDLAKQSTQTSEKQMASDIGGRTSMGKFIEVGDSFCSSPDPPITKATLSELDVPRIVFNPKLRHDVNFDPDLHFRPNLDGDSGRRKAQKATEFWDTFQTQLQSFMLM